MLPATYQVPAAVVLVAGGLLACFFGYRLFRLVLGIYGFIVGALVASSLMGPSETSSMVVAGLVGGVAGALILMLAYFVGVAIVGAGLGALAVNLAWAQRGVEPHVVVVIAASIVGAFAALWLQRYVIVGTTALGGAWTALWGAVTLADGTPVSAEQAERAVWLAFPLQPAPGHPWFYAAWIGLAVAGMIVQLSITSGRKGR
jgi:hypothetical protein